MYDAADGCGRGIRVGLVRECARTGHRDPESLAGVYEPCHRGDWGNVVESVVGVQLAAANKPDYAISVILNSSLQVAHTPALGLIRKQISPTI